MAVDSLSRVRFGSLDAHDVISASDTEVVVAAPQSPTAGVVDVTLIADTGAYTIAENAWTFVAPGVIDTVDPVSGQVGTRVTLYGQNLLQGAVNVTQVQFGNVTNNVVSFNATHVVVDVRDGGVPGTKGDIVISTETGAFVNLTDGWTFALLASIASVTPSVGHFGTIVNITGVNLPAGGRFITTAFLAGIEVDSVIVSDESDFVVVVAGASTGPISEGDVVVQADNGALTTLRNAFSYVAPGNITNVTPSSGQYGTLVRIEGTNLLGGGNELSRATLKYEDAHDIVSASNTEVVLVAAPSQAGPGPVHLYADTGAVVVAECVG